MSPYKQKPSPPKPRMAPEDVEQLMLHLMRHPRIFAVGKSSVLPAYFTTEPHFEVLWASYIKLVEKYGFGQVPEAAVHSSFAREAARLEDKVMPEAADEMLRVPGGFLDHAFKAGPGDVDERFGLDLVRDFLHEREIVDTARKVIQAAGDDIPDKWADVIGELQSKQARIEMIGQSPVHSLVPDDFSMEAVEVFPTGFSTFDKLMDGGHGRGEVNGFLAPYASGKTTLGVQLCINGSYYFLSLHRRGEPLLHTYFFTYEEDVAAIRRRAYACAGDISKSELDTKIKTVADFSRCGKLKKYERDRYAANGQLNFAELDGEYERYMALQKTINTNFHIVDMTAANSSVGTGGVDEMAALLQNERALGRIPGLVVVDYAAAMVSRFCGARSLSLKDHSRTVLKQQLQDLNYKVAAAFKVPVWIAHQYNGESQQRKVTSVMQLSDAAECKSFAENLWFCMLFGHGDADTHVAQMAVGKARRAGTQGKVCLVQLDGEFARMRDVDKEFTVDTALGKIVSNEQLNGLQAVAAAAPKQQRESAGNVFKPGFGYKRGTGEPV